MVKLVACSCKVFLPPGLGSWDEETGQKNILLLHLPLCQLAPACQGVGLSRLGSVWGPGEHHPGVALRLAPPGVQDALTWQGFSCWKRLRGFLLILCLTSAMLEPLLKSPAKSESRCVSPLWAASVHTQLVPALCPGGNTPPCLPLSPQPL